jgi:hypothetical protein
MYSQPYSVPATDRPVYGHQERCEGDKLPVCKNIPEISRKYPFCLIYMFYFACFYILCTFADHIYNKKE